MRQRLTRTSVTYHPSEQTQETLEDIRRTYGITPTELERANPGVDLGARFASGAPASGGTIELPIRDADRALEWDDAAVAEPTLTALCAARNREPIRTCMQPLTPRALWLHVLNAELRRAHLEQILGGRGPRSSDLHEEIAAIDRDPSTVQLRAGSVVWIPYPVILQMRPAAAAPGATTSFSVPPDWLLRLVHGFLLPIQRELERLRGRNETQEARIRAATFACRPFIAVERMTSVLGSIYGTDFADVQQKLRALLAALAQLINQPNSAYNRRHHHVRASEATDLFSLVRSAELNALCLRALQEQDVIVEVVGGPRAREIRGWIAQLLVDAYVQMLRVSELEDEVNRDLDQVRGAFPVDSSPPRLGPVALATMISDGRVVPSIQSAFTDEGAPPIPASDADAAGWRITGQLAGMLNNTVGNLPGPPSIMVAITQIRVTHAGVRLARGAQSMDELQPFLVDLANATGTAVADLTSGIQRIRAAQASEAQNPEGVREAVRTFREGTMSRYQGGLRWSAGLTILNLVCVYATVQNSPRSVDAYDVQVDFWSSLVGGTLASGAGVTQVGARVVQSLGGAASGLEGVAGTLGNLAAVVGVATGVIKFVYYASEGRTGDAAAAALQTAGAAMLMVPVPWVQAAGLAIVIGFAIAGLAASDDPSTKNLTLNLLEQFAATHPATNRRHAADRDRDDELQPHVQTQLDELTRAVNAADFPRVVRGSLAGRRVASWLAELRFTHELLGLMMEENHAPVYPTTEGPDAGVSR